MERISKTKKNNKFQHKSSNTSIEQENDNKISNERTNRIEHSLKLFQTPFHGKDSSNIQNPRTDILKNLSIHNEVRTIFNSRR